ncbi:MAG: bifunctional 4-hydroxy-2-oxoglutarate aldolase/2-dehydro-3-deoxy-phosphogluconate aldolase [Pseudomonadota bacterium]
MTQSQHTLNAALHESAKAMPVIPVVSLADATQADPLGAALRAGGVNVCEVTLRTPQALDAIRAMARAHPMMMIAAGTVLTPDDGAKAIEAGARFLVSPGITPALAHAAQTWPVPLLPGAATASEAMALADMGYRFQKFFPAEAAGGVTTLAALAAPLANIAFCPTGGVKETTAATYLALDNVVCVGGSWLAPPAMLADGAFEQIAALAAAAQALRPIV